MKQGKRQKIQEKKQKLFLKETNGNYRNKTYDNKNIKSDEVNSKLRREAINLKTNNQSLFRENNWKINEN